jgi:hypothetical protein
VEFPCVSPKLSHKHIQACGKRWFPIFAAIKREFGTAGHVRFGSLADKSLGQNPTLSAFGPKADKISGPLARNGQPLVN